MKCGVRPDLPSHPFGPQIEIFNFELEEKLYQHFDVKFNGESDGFEAQNLI